MKEDSGFEAYRPDDDILERYVAGECSGQEREAVELWAQNNPEESAGIRAMYAHYDEAAAVLPSSNVGLIESRLMKRLGEIRSATDADGLVEVQGRGSGRSLSRNMSWVACGIAAVLMVVSVNYSSKFKSSPPVSKTYSTTFRQRAKVTLADGSVAVLAPATTLSVTGRNVELRGEALFTVSHTSEAPFTVTADGVTTRVLGTVFSVRKYAEDKAVQVAVAEGRVAVNNSVLSNGDIAIAAKDIDVQHNAERVAELMAFTQGKLVIRSQTLAEIAPQLERWMDIRINVSGDVTSKSFSTTLTTQNIDEVLREIATLTNSKYAVTGRNVRFFAKS